MLQNLVEGGEGGGRVGKRVRGGDAAGLLAVADQLQLQKTIKNLERIETKQLAAFHDLHQRGGLGHQGEHMGLKRLQQNGADAAARGGVKGQAGLEAALDGFLVARSAHAFEDHIATSSATQCLRHPFSGSRAIS